MLLRLVKQCHSVWQEILHVFKSYNQCTALLQQAVAQWQSMCLQITSKCVQFTVGSMLSNVRKQLFPTIISDFPHTFSFDVYIHLHLYYVKQWKDIFILITCSFCIFVLALPQSGPTLRLRRWKLDKIWMTASNRLKPFSAKREVVWSQIVIDYFSISALLWYITILVAYPYSLFLL